MQSLFSTTVDGATSNTNSTNYRYWGYYADAFFDRRPFVDAVGTTDAANNSAVSVTTRDVAYIGMLFTNPTTGASLFIPAAGFRNPSNGTLQYTGNRGYYWSRSAYSTNNSWNLRVGSSDAYQFSVTRAYGSAVRCVRE